MSELINYFLATVTDDNEKGNGMVSSPIFNTIFKMRNVLKSWLIVWLFSSQILAAIPKVSSTVLPLKTFLAEGSFRGGVSGDGFTLMSVKRVYSTTGKSERFIFEMGDRSGKPYSGKIGYYHAQLFKNPSELSLDFSQLGRSRVGTPQFKALFKNSKLVENSNLVLDKQDHSTNVSMKFKYPVKMRVYSLSPKGKSPKLVVDVTRL